MLKGRKDGLIEYWNIGRMKRKNVNRGFRQLRVWNNAIDLYVLTCRLMSKFPVELKKTAGNCIDCSHSISRNIAEGYCRKSIREYHSCLYSFYKADQLSEEEYEQLDKLHYKTENGLIQRGAAQLIKSLQKKVRDGDWEDTFR